MKRMVHRGCIGFGKVVILVAPLFLVACFAKRQVSETEITARALEVQTDAEDHPFIGAFDASSIAGESREAEKIRKFAVVKSRIVPTAFTISALDSSVARLVKQELVFNVVQELYLYVQEDHRNTGSEAVTGKALSSRLLCRLDTYLETTDIDLSQLTLFGIPIADNSALRKLTTDIYLSPVVERTDEIRGESISNLCMELITKGHENERLSRLARMAENFVAGVPVEPCSASDVKREIAGDATCQRWFAKLDANLKSTAVPRCIAMDGLSADSGFCALRGRFGTRCPLYMGRDSKILGQPEDSASSLLTDTGTRQYFCDAESHEVCKARRIPSDPLQQLIGRCDTQSKN
jgi:hypothetical protein